MSLFRPQEWNFASEHPSKRTSATADEQRIYEKLQGGCLHREWARMQSADGHRTATCSACDFSVDLGRDSTEFEKADPVLSDSAVRELFLRSIPHTRYDDANANKVFRDLEAAGWHCIIRSRGDRYKCAMSKGNERFVSSAYSTKAAAITEAAGLLLRGIWPR